MKKFLMVLAVAIVGVVLTACGQNEEETFNGTINVYTRDAASGTREAFQSIVDFESSELVATAIETAGNGDQANKVGNDEYSIGYVSLSTDMAANNIKTLNFEGVEATVENVLDGSYTLSRPFNYTTRAAGDFSSDNVKDMTAAFIAYLGTKDGMAVLADKDVIVDDSAAPTWNSIKDQHPIIDSSSTITVRMGGSTSVEKSIEAAANAFKALVPAFDFTMDQTGSSDGYKRTLGENKDNNPVEIGFASRSFKSTEDVAQAMASDSFGTDAIAVVVEENNPITNISKEDLKKIYTGVITTWEDLSE